MISFHLCWSDFCPWSKIIKRKGWLWLSLEVIVCDPYSMTMVATHMTGCMVELSVCVVKSESERGEMLESHLLLRAVPVTQWHHPGDSSSSVFHIHTWMACLASILTCKKIYKPGMVVFIFSPSIWEQEPGRSLWGQPDLQIKFQVSQDPVSKQRKKKPKGFIDILAILSRVNIS